MGRLTEKELLLKKACWICCPMCDKRRCVGRTDCVEIKRFIENNSEVKE